MIERGLFGEDLSGCGNDCELGIVVLGVLDRGHILEELGITASLLDTLQLSIGLFVTMLAEISVERLERRIMRGAVG